MDFLYYALTGRKLRTLSIEDAHTREILAIEVDTSLDALRVVRVPEKPERTLVPDVGRCPRDHRRLEA